MQKRQAFTLIELLVVIGIIALLIAILLPSLAAAKKAAGKAKNGEQLRAISTGFYSWAKTFPMRRDQYPTQTTDVWWANYNGPYHTKEALSELCNFTIQPLAARGLINPFATYETMNTQSVGAIVITKLQDSYTTLIDYGNNPDWYAHSNSGAPITTDRKAPGADGFEVGPGSEWLPKKAWMGQVSWGDGHVTWQTTSTMVTRDGVGSVYPTNDIFHGGDGGNPNGFYKAICGGPDWGE